MWRRGRNCWSEPTVTIRPHFRAAMAGWRSWTRRTDDMKSILYCVSMSASAISSQGLGSWSEAFRTRMSTPSGPSGRTSSSGPSGRARSATTAVASMPSAARVARAARSFSESDAPWTNTRAPRRPSPRASANPMPRLEPVTRAVFPARLQKPSIRSARTCCRPRTDPCRRPSPRGSSSRSRTRSPPAPGRARCPSAAR